MPKKSKKLKEKLRIDEEAELLGVRVATKLYDLIGRKGFEEFQDLAAKMNVSKSQVSRWLNGDHNFELKTLVRFAYAFDLSARVEFLPQSVASNLYSYDENTYWATASTEITSATPERVTQLPPDESSVLLTDVNMLIATSGSSVSNEESRKEHASAHVVQAQTMAA